MLKDVLLKFTLPFVVAFLIGFTLKTYFAGQHPLMYLVNVAIVFLTALPATWAAYRWAKGQKDRPLT
jgi:hypothetical protein